MGTGTFDPATGRFNLLLSIRHNAGSDRLDEWQAAFQQASELLFDATDEQHQFGDIYVCNGSTGGHIADAWLDDSSEEEASSGGYPGLGQEGTHQTFHSIHRFRPFVILHEFGHYAYGLYDEITFGDDPGGCTGTIDHEACIMEWTWEQGERFGDDGTGGSLVPGDVSEFCTTGNHNPNLYQPNPCWETMTNGNGLSSGYPDLEIPGGLPQTLPPAGADLINWTVLAPEQRFVLVVDRSDSMSGNKLTEAKNGAAWWADQSVVGDLLGIVSYSDTATSEYPLQQITGESDRSNVRDAIDSISAGGETSIGGGLREGLNQIMGAGMRAATQVIVLLTDGLHNIGEHPSNVLPDLIDNGVRVYTIGIGPTIDTILLEQIATNTGGAFYRIDPALPPDDQEFEIRLKLQEISGIVRENGGLVTTILGSTNPGLREEEAYIESGSEMATFALSWKNPEDLLALELESPQGEHITLESPPDNVRPIYSGRPYVGFHVGRPAVGTWKLIVKPEKVVEVANFRLFVFSQNPHIGGGLLSPWRFYKPGDVIPLQFQAYYNRPVTGLKISGEALLSNVGRIPLEFEFSDDGNRGSGDVVPRDGLYSTYFQETGRSGIYTFEVIAESDGESASYARHGMRTDRNEDHESDPIPRFRRQFRLAVAVGEEPFKHVVVEPNNGQQGEKLEATLKGRLTHFRQGFTSADFGKGIDAGEVKVLDKHTAMVSIYVNEEAQLGPRNVTITTAIYREAVEVEGGFHVVGKRSLISLQNMVSSLRSWRPFYRLLPG